MDILNQNCDYAYKTNVTLNMDISHQTCHKTYMAVRVSRLAKKFLEVLFHHETRLGFPQIVLFEKVYEYRLSWFYFFLI